MAFLRIKKVYYEGDNYFYDSPDLDQELCIIEGENKSGKSTFSDLIYFGLGGNPEQFRPEANSSHQEIVKDENNYVRLLIEINEEEYVLKRRFGDTTIQVIQDESLRILAINRNKDSYIFSDWLLEKLGITTLEVFQGTRSWMINFTDLSRLIYYNQSTDLDKIYKSPDNENFLTDSLEIRKLIFQLLIGKAYNAYYKKLAETKKKRREFESAKGLFEEYNLIADELLLNQDDSNLKHLRGNKNEKEEQIERLYRSRESIQSNRPQKKENLNRVENIKEDLSELEEEEIKLDRELNKYQSEIFDLKNLRKNITLEITQIEKIITTHEKLDFFSPNTCPNCLREVDRSEGECICGKPIEENEYIKIFYEEDEYLEILEEKQSTRNTVEKSVNILNRKILNIKEEISEIRSEETSLENEIRELISDVSEGFDTSEIDKIDDLILRLKEDISQINRQIEVEDKRQAYQKRLNDVRDDLKRLEMETESLYLEAEKDMQEKVSDFNEIYNDLMTSGLNDCRSARIDHETYMPIINEGAYREQSAKVPRRLMYYLTLLKMSLEFEEINFPRFLLIDTPEAAGIDDSNLIKCLSQLKDFLERDEDKQIILTTGLGKYPDGMGDYVVETLKDSPGLRLLQKKDNEEK